jgi:hypothetical protein
MSERAPRQYEDFPRSDPEKDDELGRKQFCRKLARILANGNAAGSTVYALYGDWGVGKTTAKNFAVHFLKKEHGIAPIEFEPWGWSGRDNVVEALFAKLETSLGKTDLKATEKWVRSVHRMLGITAPMLDAAKFVWPLVATFFTFGFVWLGSTYAIKDQWSKTILLGLAGLGSLLWGAHKLTQALSNYYTEVKTARFAALDDVRTGLIKELVDQGKPLVVIIDDIDRLEPAEIRQVIQVVKAVANLPHVVFLLLFQRDVVSRALEEVAGKDKGQEFLEKVVQVGFHVPEPPPGRIMAMLENVLAELRKDHRIARLWEEARWTKRLRPAVEGYFRNARDVTRFGSAMNVFVDQHIYGESFEVNPLDLVGLEALRLFEPALYERLAAVPLTGPSELVQLLVPNSKESSERRRLDLDRLTKLLHEENRVSGGRVLRVLFPQLQEQYESKPEELTKWDRELRVSHPYHYSKYFDMNLLQDRATDGDFQAIMDAATGSTRLLKQLETVAAQKLLPDVLARVAPRLEGQSSQVSESFVRALVEVGENLPDSYDDDDHAGAKENATALTIQSLRQIPDGKQRLELWRDVVEGSPALDLPVHITSVLESLTKRNDSMMPPVFTTTEIAELCRIALERIQADARSGRLVSRPWFLRHLYRWSEWGKPGETKQWASEFVKDPPAARRILLAWNQVIISTGETVRRIPVLMAEDLDRIIGFEVLEGQLSNVAPNTEDSSDEDIALQLFALARDLKSSGKSYKQVTLPGTYY